MTESLLHLPNFIIVVISTLWISRSIANVLRTECVPTESAVMPRTVSPIANTADLRVFRTSVDSISL